MHHELQLVDGAPWYTVCVPSAIAKFIQTQNDASWFLLKGGSHSLKLTPFDIDETLLMLLKLKYPEMQSAV